jgi:hypothetical protein
MKTIVTSMPVLALEINEEGTVAQKSMQLTRQGQLENTLLDALYPGIRVATVEIPGAELDDYGRAKVEQALARFTVGGVEYRLVGASSSAKDGRYYAVNKEFERVISELRRQQGVRACDLGAVPAMARGCGHLFWNSRFAQQSADRRRGYAGARR